MHRLTLLLVLALSLLWHSEARADAKSRAKEFARSGMTAFKRGNYKKAIQRIRLAEAEYHAVTHIVYIGRSQRALGKLVEAYNAYISVVAERLEDDAPPSFFKSQQLASAEAAELLPQVATVRVVPHGVAQDGATVTIGEFTMTSSRLLHPLAVEPGRHRVTGRSPDADDVHAEVVAATGKTRIVELRFERRTAPTSPSTSPSSRPSTPSGDDRSGWSGLSIGAAAALSFAGVGLVVGTITGAMSTSQVDDIRSQCQGPDMNDCPAALEPDAKAARTLGTTSTISFIAGSAAVALGVVLLVLDLSADETQGSLATPSLSVRAVPSGVQVTTRW